MGAYTELAKRTAPKGRAPTAGELWTHRMLRCLDCVDADTRREHTRLMHAILGVMARPRESQIIVAGEGWQPNPHKGDFAGVERRTRELWAEIGELLGIGPPPWARP